MVPLHGLVCDIYCEKSFHMPQEKFYYMLSSNRSAELGQKNLFLKM